MIAPVLKSRYIYSVVWIEHRLVTDRQTDKVIANTTIAQRRAGKKQKGAYRSSTFTPRFRLADTRFRGFGAVIIQSSGMG